MQNPKSVVAGSVLICGLLFAGMMAYAGCTTVEAGYRGVKKRFGNVTGEPLMPGLHFMWPGAENITEIEVRDMKFAVSTQASSKDLQIITTKVAVNFHPNPAEVHTLYQTVGEQYRERIMEPALEETVKSITAQYTAEELVTKRTEVRTKMMALLTEKLKSSHIFIRAFNIEDFRFSNKFNQAIESKQEAEQDALRAQNELEKERIEADKKIEEARGLAESVKLAALAEALAIEAKAKAEASAIKMRGEAQAAAQAAIAASLTDDVIRFRALEKWNGTVPKINGVGPVPFLDLTGELNK